MFAGRTALTSARQSGVDFELVFLALSDMAAPQPRAAVEEADCRRQHACVCVRPPLIAIADDEASVASESELGDGAQQLDAAALNRLADKVARRIAKLTQYVAERARGGAASDHKVARKIARAEADLAKYSAQLVALEQQLAVLSVSDESDLRSYLTRADSGAATAATAVDDESASQVSTSSTPRRRHHRRRTANDESSERPVAPAPAPEQTLTAECDMCGEAYAASPTRPRWVFVPSVRGAQRLAVCSACCQAAEGSAAPPSDADSAPFAARRVLACGPPTPTEHAGLHVPRYYDNKQNVHSGSLLLLPDIVVSHYKNTGTLHVSHLQRRGAVLVPNAAPLLSVTSVPPFVLSVHDNERLQVFDATSETPQLALLDCAPAFDSETSGKSRALIANERWVVLASKERLCVWAWRVVLGATGQAVPPGRVLQLESVASVRADFSSYAACCPCALVFIVLFVFFFFFLVARLVNEHLVLGSNHQFSVWDLLQGACVYSFSFRRSTATLSSFYQIRWTGETVATLEANGARLWHVFGVAGALNATDKAPSQPFVPATASPLITPTDGTVFTALHVTNELMLLGDSLGNIRACDAAPHASHCTHTGVRPTKQSKLTARRASRDVSDVLAHSAGRSKLDKILGTQALDADGAYELLLLLLLCAHRPRAPDRSSICVRVTGRCATATARPPRSRARRSARGPIAR